MTRANNKSVVTGMVAALLLASGLAGAQERIGEALFVNGISTAQRPGEAARFLAKGDAITQGDVINTGGRGFAVIGLEDGTKMTLRPNTSFAIDKFSQKPNEENLLMRLLRGGLRAVTGVIAKRSSEAVKINTTTATIGIRGTEFDARLCGADCRDEAKRAKPVPPVASADAAVARVARVSGSALAVSSSGEARQLSQGAALFNGETVRTAAGAYAVLAFRDQSKVTVVEKSEMKLANVGFGAGQPDTGAFVVRLVQGGLRALTGLLGRRDPRAVKFETVVATIGIRGTGVDIRLASHCFEVAASAPPPSPPPRPRGSKSKKAAAAPTALPPTKVCADDSAYAYTWDGAVGIEGGGGDQVVEKERAGVFNPRRGKPELLAEVPAFFLDEVAPRPDQVDVDFQQLFGMTEIDGTPDGLYVGVRKGHVDITAAGGRVDLGPWETGILADGSTTPVRAAQNPGFLFNDPYPTPDVASEQTLRLIELISPGGEPGVGICEMYK